MVVVVFIRSIHQFPHSINIVSSIYHPLGTLLHGVCIDELSRVQLFAIPWTVDHGAPLSMECVSMENTGVGFHTLL